MKITSYGRSFIGRRLINQDSITETIIDSERDIYFFAIADGMGGLDCGEIASHNRQSERKQNAACDQKTLTKSPKHGYYYDLENKSI